MAPCVRFLQCAGCRFDSLSWEGPEEKLVASVQIQIERLVEKAQEQAGREDILRRTVQTRTELLKQAFFAVKVVDFPAWLNGWEDYQRKNINWTDPKLGEKLTGVGWSSLS